MELIVWLGALILFLGSFLLTYLRYRFLWFSLILSLNLMTYFFTSFPEGLYRARWIYLANYGASFKALCEAKYYVMLTSLFLHANIFHLAFNMVALVILYPYITSLVNSAKTFCIYFFSGLASSLISSLFSTAVSVGASGAIFGLLGGDIGFKLKRGLDVKIDLIASFPLLLGAGLFNVNVIGHFAGFFTGLLAGFKFSRE